MRAKVLSAIVGLIACGSGFPAEPLPAPAAHLVNATEVRQRLGLLPEYAHVPGLDRLKIAVLDYGFDGIGSGRPYLPKPTVVIENYDAGFVRRFGLGDPDYHKSFAPGNPHGRVMAQIIWAMTGSDPHGPQFYLLNANGPTMLRRAVRYAIEAHVDIILFSNVFEGGGAGDGSGPINQVVEQALDAGVIWINAAGNYGNCVYEGPVNIGPDGYLRFANGTNPTALRFRNRLDENPITVTLTWNDYRQLEDAGTTKDLDLYVQDAAGHGLAASELKQVAESRLAGAGETRNPRERVVLTNLAADPERPYRIRILARSRNFTARDRIRVLVSAGRESYMDAKTGMPTPAVEFIDATGKSEIYPPADNPRVLTVGDLSSVSSVGPTADYRLKPDLVLPDSHAFFSDGSVSSGSSNAAAYFAGVVAVLKAAEPGLRTSDLLRLAYRSMPSATNQLRSASTDRAYSANGRDYLPMPRSVTARASSARSTMTGYPNSPVLAYPSSRSRALLPYPAYSSSTSARTLNTRAPRRELLSAPRASVSPSDPRAALRGNLWQTPTRSALAQLVRSRR